MTVTIPSLSRQQVNWWAISAGIVMVGYAFIAGRSTLTSEHIAAYVGTWPRPSRTP